jgi:hypothetical protein
MSIDEQLRKEIFGRSGFASWLREEIFGRSRFASRLQAKKKLSGKVLAELAQKQIQEELGSVNCENVNKYLCRLLDFEYKEIYLELEREMIDSAVEEFLNADEQRRGEYPTLKELFNELQRLLEQRDLETRETLIAVSKRLSQFYKLLMESFAQSRKTRAGVSAQYHVEFILNQLGYQDLFERQRKLNGKVDFLFPSFAMWQTDRQRCTVLSIKRTLRERHKQVFEERLATGGLTVYLMSTQTESEAQKDITAEIVQRLKEQNVYLVVRDAIKQERFPEETSVLGFTDFFCKELPRLKTKNKWKTKRRLKRKTKRRLKRKRRQRSR